MNHQKEDIEEHKIYFQFDLRKLGLDILPHISLYYSIRIVLGFMDK